MCVFVALIILHIKCIHLIKISSVACLCHTFPHYLITDTIFGKKVLGRRMCVLIFSTTLVSNSSHSKRTERDMIKKICIGLQVKCPSCMSDCNET